MKMHQGNAVMGGQATNVQTIMPAKSEDVLKLESAVRSQYSHRADFHCFRTPDNEYFARTAYTFDDHGNPIHQYIIARVLMHTPFNFGSGREWRAHWLAFRTGEGLRYKDRPASADNMIQNTQFVHFLQFLQTHWNSGLVRGFITDKFLVPKHKATWVNKTGSNYGSDIPLDGASITEASYNQYEADMLAQDMLVPSNVIEVFTNGFQPSMVSHLGMAPMPESSAWLDMNQITKNLHVKHPPVKNMISGYAAINFAPHKENDPFYGLQVFKKGQPGEKNVLRGDGLLFASAMSSKTDHAHVQFEWIDKNPIAHKRPSRAEALNEHTKDAPPLEFDWTGELSTQDNKKDMSVKYIVQGVAQKIHNQIMAGANSGGMNEDMIAGLTTTIDMDSMSSDDEEVAGSPGQFLADEQVVDTPVAETSDDLDEAIG